MLEQKERQKLLAHYEHRLWDSIGDDQSDQQGEQEPSETIELGVKITIEQMQDDLQFTLASVDVPVAGAEYTSLAFSDPVSTVIHLYWLPRVPDDQTCAAVMAALDSYLTTIIRENEQLNVLYAGKSPFHT